LLTGVSFLGGDGGNDNDEDDGDDGWNDEGGFYYMTKMMM